MRIVKRSVQRKKSKAKKAVAITKGRAYDSLYDRLETNESERSSTDWLGRETEKEKMYNT